MSCIFCKIINNEIPCTKVYENNDVLAFLDIAPSNFGHTLVIPKKHIETFDEADENTLLKLNIIAKKIAKKLKEHYKGYNILINNKEVAGQVVPHLHIHVIPRTKDDNFKLEWTHKEYDNDSLKKYKEYLSIK